MDSDSQHSDPVEALVARVQRTALPPPAERARIRASVGVSLRDLAVVLNVSATTIQGWERGTTTPRAHHAEAYADALHRLRRASDAAAG